MRLATAALTAAGLLTVSALPIHAQAASGGGLLQHYSFNDAEAAGLESFSLITLPFGAGIALGRHLAVDVSGAWAEGVATGPDGGEATLSGLTDTHVGLSLLLGRDLAVLTTGLTLPTGAELTSLESATVAGVVSAELLPFAIKTWGTGGGAGGDIALAFQAGDWGIGLAGGYWTANEFEPVGDVEYVYRPGDQIQARVALDRDVGDSGTLSVVAGFQRFGEDAVSDINLFRSGNRIEGLVSYAFALGLRGSALLHGGVFHRDQGVLLVDEALLDGATDSPSQQLFMAGADLLVPLSRTVHALPTVDMRVFRTEDGVGQGWLATAGAAFDIRVAGRTFGRQVVLSPSGKLRLGHVVVRDGAESDIVGWEAGVTLRVETGR